MIPWERLASTTLPGDSRPLVLCRRGTEYVIRVGTLALMSSAAHGSEDELAERVCERIAGRAGARVLVGGLGMGFTLAAALRRLGADARVEVAELLPAVVEWNRGVLAPLAGRPLADPRGEVFEGDVADRLRAGRAPLDAVLLDVDNGPDGLTVASNDRLYAEPGLRAAFASLRPGGVLGVWSAAPDPGFTRRLGRAGFEVEEVNVRARRGKGGRHVLWLAARPAGPLSAGAARAGRRPGARRRR